MATKPVGRKNAGAAADVLGQLANLVPTTAKPKPGKATKWELPLTDEAKSDALRWVGAKAVFEPVEKRMENSRDEFKAYSLKIMAEKLFANKQKPSNPLVVIYKDDKKTVDHQFQLTMQDRFKYRFPEVPEGVDSRDHFIEVFRNIGLSVTDAEALVDGELDFNPITGLRSLTELMEGRAGEKREWIDSTPEEKSAGQKLAALLMWQGGDAPEPLTLEEKALVIQRSPGMTVKAGFYSRVATYCKSVDQLLGVFTVIQPVMFPASLKFAINDTATDKTKRLIGAAADILGTTTFSEDDDA